MLPTLTNELVLTIKDTSLISVLGVSAATLELTKFARNGVEKTLNLTPFVAAGVVYLAMTIPLTRFASYLERRVTQSR
jgi:polar amino acid transport system permease protein